ncbi:MAG: hypothetical protein ISS19_08130 [Bacteroidales bacterium]|nr:hypothetical protein [Bacteroidales bacterium]
MKIRTLGLMSYPIVYNINITYTLLLLVLWVIEICYLDYFIVISENIQIDYELLSEKGKKDHDKMMDIRKLKIAAVNNQEFERAPWGSAIALPLFSLFVSLTHRNSSPRGAKSDVSRR